MKYKGMIMKENKVGDQGRKQNMDWRWIGGSILNLPTASSLLRGGNFFVLIQISIFNQELVDPALR